MAPVCLEDNMKAERDWLSKFCARLLFEACFDLTDSEKWAHWEAWCNLGGATSKRRHKGKRSKECDLSLK